MKRGERIEDAVFSLIFAITKNFIGDLDKYGEESFDSLVILKFPTLSDFRWCKGVFSSKVLVRSASSQAKKIITCTPPSEVTHACLLDLDSTPSRSHHGFVLCQNPTTKQAVTYLFRFVHIKPSPDETNTTDVLHDHLREKPISPATI